LAAAGLAAVGWACAAGAAGAAGFAASAGLASGFGAGVLAGCWQAAASGRAAATPSNATNRRRVSLRATRKTTASSSCPIVGLSPSPWTTALGRLHSSRTPMKLEPRCANDSSARWRCQSLRARIDTPGVRTSVCSARESPVSDTFGVLIGYHLGNRLQSEHGDAVLRLDSRRTGALWQAAHSLISTQYQR
jgi:hypothetical protein